MSGLIFLLGLSVLFFVVLAVVDPHGLAMTVLSWLAGVRSRADFEQFAPALWRRYTKSAELCDVDDVQAMDRAITYTERIIDRQINKARGILPFNSLLLTLLIFQVGFSKDRDPAPPSGLAIWNIGTMILLVLSSLLLLGMFRVRIGQVDHYKTFSAEIVSSVDLIRGRATTVQFAILLSILGLLGIVLSSLWFLLPEGRG